MLCYGMLYVMNIRWQVKERKKLNKKLVLAENCPLYFVKTINLTETSLGKELKVTSHCVNLKNIKI